MPVRVDRSDDATVYAHEPDNLDPGQKTWKPTFTTNQVVQVGVMDDSLFNPADLTRPGVDRAKISMVGPTRIHLIKEGIPLDQCQRNLTSCQLGVDNMVIGDSLVSAVAWMLE